MEIMVNYHVFDIYLLYHLMSVLNIDQTLIVL